MATYNLGVQVYIDYDGYTGQQLKYVSKLDKALEHFVTKDLYNYIDSHFKNTRPFLINEVGTKTTIVFISGISPEYTGILITKTDHYIDSSKLTLKYIEEIRYSDGRPVEYWEDYISFAFSPPTSLDFYITIESGWCEQLQLLKEVPTYEPDFNWKSWATKEKAKLDNYKKGDDIKFWDTGKKMVSSALIMGGTLGFSANGANYTLDDIISGTLSKEALGKTFNEGMAKCKGIWLKIGGILGSILKSSIVKTISGSLAAGGIFYVSSAIFNKTMDYTQSLTGSMDEVSYPGWWTQGTTYTQDSTTGSGMAVVPSKNSSAVDNWENYAYTNTNSKGYVTGATSAGTTVTQGNANSGTQGNSNLGTVTLATGATVALGIAAGTSIPLAVPETAKVGLNILEGQAITLDLDAVESMTPLPIQPVEWKNVPPPWMVNPIELHLSDNLSNWTVPNIKIDTPVLPKIKIDTPVLPNIKIDTPVLPNIKIDTPVLPNIKIDTPTLPNIQIDGSAITLTPPESIPLTAPTEPMSLTLEPGAKVGLEETSLTGITTIAEKIVARDVREADLHADKKAVLGNQKTLTKNDVDMMSIKNKIVTKEQIITDLKSKAMEQPIEGKNYVERVASEYTNLHSTAESSVSDVQGNVFTTPKGLIGMLGLGLPVILNELLTKITSLNLSDVDKLDKVKDEIESRIAEIMQLHNIKKEDLPNLDSSKITENERDILSWYLQYENIKNQSIKVGGSNA